MAPPECEHGSREWAVVVVGDTERFGQLLTSAGARGCHDCCRRSAEFWFRQEWVYEVAVVLAFGLEGFDRTLRGVL